MWVTSGCEMACAVSCARRASLAWPSSPAERSIMVVILELHGGVGGTATQVEVLLDAGFGALVDPVEDQQRHGEQERKGAVDAYCQADALHHGLRLLRQAGLVAVVGEDRGDQRAAHAEAGLQPAPPRREDARGCPPADRP